MRRGNIALLATGAALLAGACTTAEGLLDKEPTHVVAHAPHNHLAVKECVREALALEQGVAMVRHGSDSQQSWIIRPTANVGGGNVLWVTQFYLDSTVVYGGWHVGNRHGDNLLPIIERCLASTANLPATVQPAAAAVPPVAVPAAAAVTVAPRVPEPDAGPVGEDSPFDGFASRLKRLEAEKQRLDANIEAVYRDAEAAGISREELRREVERTGVPR